MCAFYTKSTTWPPFYFPSPGPIFAPHHLFQWQPGGKRTRPTLAAVSTAAAFFPCAAAKTPPDRDRVVVVVVVVVVAAENHRPLLGEAAGAEDFHLQRDQRGAGQSARQLRLRPAAQHQVTKTSLKQTLLGTRSMQ